MSGDALGLPVEITDGERSTVVRIAREWIGTKFRHQHSMKGVATDCAGLLRGVGKEAGLLPPDLEERPEYAEYLAYTRNPDGRLLPALHAFLKPIPSATVLPADLVLMRFGAKEPRHLAIIVDTHPLVVVHALNQPGVDRVIEMTVDDHMRRRQVAGFFRYVGLE